jgi:hypothetical protein
MKPFYSMKLIGMYGCREYTLIQTVAEDPGKLRGVLQAI